MRKMEITPPSLPADLEERDAAFPPVGEEVAGRTFRRQVVPPHAREHLWVSGCRFVGCSFPASELHAAHFTDTLFSRCDLSNVKWAGCVFQRVVFDECKLVGADLSTASWFHVLFEGCRAGWANFSEGRFRFVRFAGGELRGGVFGACRFDRVEYARCDLTEAEFRRPQLRAVRRWRASCR